MPRTFDTCPDKKKKMRVPLTQQPLHSCDWIAQKGWVLRTERTRVLHAEPPLDHLLCAKKLRQGGRHVSLT
jgi:hypothetical protein